MLRDCKYCGTIGLALCACVIGEDVARSMTAEPSKPGFIAFRADDPAHTESDINAPQPARLPPAAWTASSTMMQLSSWNPVPPSVASSPPNILYWKTADYWQTFGKVLPAPPPQNRTS